MSTSTTAAPTAAIRERWESESLVTGDYARDCMAVAAETLEHVGFSHVDATPWEDVLSCMEGDLPVTVCVLPVPTEGWELTLDDVQGMCDGEVAARGAAMCVCSAVMADAPLPEHARFDVMSVCLNLGAGRMRVHHVRGVWQG